MSQVYINEPNTNGKVLFHTSVGDLDIELWSKEAPNACRKFIQYCYSGLYHNNLNKDIQFVRVIKGFMAQISDPVDELFNKGLAEASELDEEEYSKWKSKFDLTIKDEFHQRIKFNHRGQVALVNENRPDSNRPSQFFITLGPCEHLNRKHTIFGKVTGNTIYNLLKIGEADTDSKECPLSPIKILGVEILANPFDDLEMLPNVETFFASKKKSTSESTASSKKGSSQSSLAVATTTSSSLALKKSLISFGDDDEDSEMIKIDKKKTLSSPPPSLSMQPVSQSNESKSGNKTSRDYFEENQIASQRNSSDTLEQNTKKTKPNLISSLLKKNENDSSASEAKADSKKTVNEEREAITLQKLANFRNKLAANKSKPA